MKRNWEPPPPAFGSSSGSINGQKDDNVWVHPYASAYSSMSIPYNPTTLSSITSGSYDSIGAYGTGIGGHADKRVRMSDVDRDRGVREGSSQGKDDSEKDEDEEDDDEDDDGEGKGTTSKGKGGKGRGSGKEKVKLTRGSRACIACRKIKMRCIPDESTGATGPCKRCKSGGHECIFEESNRGKRSTRKNEALAAKVAKMEAALRGVGAALSNIDQPSLNSFSTALHSVTADPDVIQVITSHASPAVVPTLAVAMQRSYATADSFSHYGGESSNHVTHSSQPPLSPRLHSLPDNVLSPLGLLAEASLQNTDKKHLGNYAKHQHRPSPLSIGEGRASPARNGTGMSASSPGYRMATSDVRGGKESGDDDVGGYRGVASQNYFKPGMLATAVATGTGNKLPELLSIVTREEIGELFDLFFDHMAGHFPLVYREFHTPDLVLQRSQFLCTVICAIAARFYQKRRELHTQLSAYAKRLAFEVPSRGYKSVEVVQAYLLLSMWTLGPEKTFEQDRTWMMLGMAIRMATDLNLHRKSMPSGLDTDEGRARDLEIINRERCWLLCFILDRSLSSQMGKPYTLREDYIIRSACEASWHQQRFSLPSDRFLAAYVVLQQIMSRAIDSIYSSTTTITGLRQDCDYMLIVRSAHEELRRSIVEWKPVLAAGTDPASLRTAAEYESRHQFYFAYHSLVLYSFGLENALERAKMDISFFLTNVHEAATRVCNVIKEQFLPKGFLTYLPDSSFVMCSYALLSLLKLLKPELRSYHDSEETIIKLVTEMADILEDCAADASHQPAIYAAFIRQIVLKTKRPPTAPPSRVGSPSLAGLNGTLMSHSAGADVFDPQLLGQTADWQPGDLMEGPQFTFIPQGGDMMILPSAAGPSESVQNSPSASFLHSFTNSSVLQPATPNGTANSSGWAEYLPTFMSSDGFDGWDGSMLLPGFGRGQITLGGGLLHSQYGSGIITPAQHSPTQSRAGSRAGSRAASPS